MNRDEVKEKLLLLHTCAVEFNVLFSGKKSKKVNGIYKNSRDIVIHNKNFTKDETLFYTAMHELAHHILVTEYNQKGSRSHTRLFWRTFHDLVDKAESLGIYKQSIDDTAQKLIREARELSCQIAELQRKLGNVIIKLYEHCQKTGDRPEALLERNAQISRGTSGKAMLAARLDLPKELGADIQEAILSERSQENHIEMVKAGTEGKTVAQIKRAPAARAEKEDEGETERLIKEKGRLMKTIKTLVRRLNDVEKELDQLNAARKPPDKAADKINLPGG
ncbi:MAG: hypothetical protein LBF78_07490 [Treponema sp.]|jgi:predicted  nucleic acid-binding Zn-ribbon protein|nr:hypothetical protein [Treponema sp.]